MERWVYFKKTDLRQNRFEYSEFDAWKPDTTEIVHAVNQEFLQ